MAQTFTHTARTRLTTFWRECAVLGWFSLSFIILTWPLVLHMNSGIAGSATHDAPVFFWNAWEWARQLTQGTFGAFTTTDVLFPGGTSLLAHTHTQVQSLAVLGFRAMTGQLTLSFNLVYLLSAVAGAYFTYRFFHLVTQRRLPAILAGQFFGFQHLWAVYAVFGTQNILTTWYLPAALYWFEKFAQSKRRWFAGMVGLVVALAFLNDWVVCTMTVGALGVYAVGRQLLLQRLSWVTLRRFTAISAIAFLLIGGWKLPVLYQQRASLAAIPTPSVADVDFYHADPLNLVRPAQFHALWGGLSQMFHSGAQTNGNAFVGFGFLALVVATCSFRRRSNELQGKRHLVLWLGGAFVFFLLALGPFLHVAGQDTRIPMPYYLLAKVTSAVNNFRVPARWLFVMMLFLSGVVAMMAERVFRNLTRRWSVYVVFSLIIGMFVLDALMVPKTILSTRMLPSTAVVSIHQSPCPAVLDLPLGITSGYDALGSSEKSSLLRQTQHGKPILNGYVSRLAPRVFQQYQRDPVLQTLLHPTRATLTTALPNRQDILQFFSTFREPCAILDTQAVNAEFGEGVAALLQEYLGEVLGFRRTTSVAGYDVYLPPAMGT